MLDDPVSGLADALVAAHRVDVGLCLHFFQRLLGALGTLSQLLVDLLLGGHQVFLLCDLQQTMRTRAVFSAEVRTFAVKLSRVSWIWLR